MKYICGRKYISGALQDYVPGEADGIYSFEVVLAADYEAEVARLWDVILNCESIYANGGSGKSMAQYLRGVIDTRTIPNSNPGQVNE